MAALFSSWNIMEPHGTTTQTQISLSSTDKYSKHTQKQGSNVFCLGLASRKPAIKSCHRNRLLFTNWMIKLKPFNPFEVDVRHLFFRKRCVPDSYLTAVSQGSPSPG